MNEALGDWPGENDFEGLDTFYRHERKSFLRLGRQSSPVVATFIKQRCKCSGKISAG